MWPAVGGWGWLGICKKKIDTYHYTCINISNSLLVKFFFFLQNIEEFVIEEGETRILSSKFSDTGRTSKFFFYVFVNDEITTLNTFNKEKARKLKNTSWFQILRIHSHPIFGLALKADAVVSAPPLPQYHTCIRVFT